MKGLKRSAQNKRQAYLAAGLCSVVVLLGAWEAFGGGTQRVSPPLPQVASRGRLMRSASDAGRAGETQAGPLRLRADELARSENVDYAREGRDVFSTALPPVPVEAPIAPARPEPSVVAAAPLPAGPPPMDMKYLGFAETDSGKLTALFMHGDDFLTAHTGDIVFHRFRVGAIQAATAQVTDLSTNDSRTISVVSN